MKKTTKIFTRRNLINLALAGALYTQVSHAGYLFTFLSHDQSGAASRDGFIAGLAIEAAVFIFTIFNDEKAVKIFAGFSMMTNLFYYITPDTIGNWYKLMAGIFFSFLIPTAIYFYSEIIKKENLKAKAAQTYAKNKASGKHKRKAKALAVAKAA